MKRWCKNVFKISVDYVEVSSEEERGVGELRVFGGLNGGIRRWEGLECEGWLLGVSGRVG